MVRCKDTHYFIKYEIFLADILICGLDLWRLRYMESVKYGGVAGGREKHWEDSQNPFGASKRVERRLQTM